jgi:elongator complex protein 3
MDPGLRLPDRPEEIHRAKLEARAAGASGPLPSNVAYARRAGLAGGAILRKPTRSLSGVAIVAVMTAPAPCPHGRCTYCPGGLDHRSPQSYTGEEPSALRAAQFGYDASRIVSERVRTLSALGHPTSKVEVIVQGGTFPARPWAHQERVYRGIFEGLNGAAAPDLPTAQLANERAEHRLVSLTVETRPDWCDGRVLPDLLRAGVTRVEIGVECLRDEVLSSVGRAHAAGDVERATREARDRGLKVGYHLMLGLPGMDPTRDLEDLRRLFQDPAFRPDMLKIYPTLVVPGTPLYETWRAGGYHPYDEATAAELLAEIKAGLPPWVRIMRIQRDIPARLIAAGVRKGNLRQMALARLASRGLSCPCLRCREVGRRARPRPEEFELVAREYEAGGGRERFLSFEDPQSGAVAGYLRLRFPSASTPGGLRAPVVRELKVLGEELAVGAPAEGSPGVQHRGFGRRLMAEAARSAREAGEDRLYVMSAVGTRPYYRRLGFVEEGPHMVLPLRGPEAA